MAWWHVVENWTNWDWASITQTALGAGVGAAAVNGVVALVRDFHHRRALAAYMAMRLAVTLEAYAAACADLITANGNAHHPPGQEFPNWSILLPKLSAYPDDPEGWRAIDRKLAGRVLNLRNRIDASQGVIDSVIEHDMDDFEDSFNEHAAARGREACELAVALRRKHRIEEADLIWDYSEHLAQTLATARSAQAERARRSAEFFNKIAAKDEEPAS